ncbi:MAG: Do family serine endopeptidase [Defluviicoccus sp.]|nr:Do family serine endopeptidase [Defluviicoccus sp.]MDE0386048.1 Do family serine endopeptidase [Defluviicoccus sp.]
MTATLTFDKRVLHRVVLPGALAAAMATAASGIAHARPAPESFADIAARVGPAVVNIATDRGAAPAMLEKPGDMPKFSPFFNAPEGQFREFMERFFGRSMPDFRFGGPMRPDHRMSAVGSGFIVDEDGHVVTNNHVVAGARSIRVRLHDGDTFDAKLVGGDAKTDLALLKIDAGRPLPFVEFGDSDRIRAGDWVMTIGNPFGLGGSVTAGIVSARGRDLRGGSLVDFLQIDAPINQGNSGGPAFDATGKVIGVNASIYSPTGGNVGIGFAIPSNDAKRVIAGLKADGKIERGWLGVQIQPVTPDIAESLGMKDATGALVASLAETGPARDAGLEQGDIITKWDGAAVEKFRDLPRLVAGTEAGKVVELAILREGKAMTLSVTTGLMPTAQKVASAPAKPAREGLAGTGITVADIDPAARSRFGLDEAASGALIRHVESDSPAWSRGIRAGDVIERVTYTPVKSAADAVEAVEQVRKDGRKAVLLTIDRKGEDRIVAVRFADA